MKKISALLFALIFFALVLWLAYRRIQESRVHPQVRVRPVPVEIAPVEHSTLAEDGLFRGALVARSQFTLAPKVPGRLQRLAVDIGSEIHHGMLIAVLESDEYEHQVEQAQAELEVSQAALEEAESARAVAASNLRRVRELHGERIASDANLEEAEARKNAADANVKLAQAQIRQREALLDSARVRLSYTRLHAEWDDGKDDIWLVARRYADEGSMLRANDPVVSVVEIASLLAVVHAIERDFPAISIGQQSFLRTDAYPGEEFEGKVVRRAPVLDEASRHARIEIEVANPDRKLAPGMFVRARIRFDVRENVRVIPRSALVRRNRKQGVFLVDSESMTADFVEVDIGILSDGHAELLAPDLDGYVVTLGHHLLEDGGSILLPSGEAPGISGSGRAGDMDGGD